MIDVSGIGAFLGLDVGKGEHHATAVTPAGKKAFDKRLPNSEPKLREVFGKLKARHGTVLVVVDQPASIGALPLAVARDMDCPVECVLAPTRQGGRRSAQRGAAGTSPGRSKERGATRHGARRPGDGGPRCRQVPQRRD
ncbi:transposase [Streptomyces sp. NPDC005065]|uniref:IS110 family transposase n=1 Tax=Streptomyces sp. NPDC005065 TaxID=3154461 RepID=UPI0033B0931E